ncbi:tudor domain protein [Trichuris suis]|nr:tudor domain protein [Trichuris suis]
MLYGYSFVRLKIPGMNIVESYQSQSVLFESGLHGHRLKAGRVYEVAIGNWVSPVEFHVVFRCFEKTLRELRAKLNRFYADSVAPADLSKVGVGAPCCVRAYKDWHRAEVVWPCGTRGDEFHVRLVDSGESKYVPKEEVRLLSTDFATLPPLAVECEMLGVNKNCLTGRILNSFTRRCRRRSTFLLSFVVEFEKKLFVRLFDRNMNDLFFVYFGEMIERAEQAERQRAAARAEKERDKSGAEEQSTSKGPVILYDIDDLQPEDM